MTRFLLLLLSLAALAVSPASAGERRFVSVPDLAFEKGELVQRFEFEVEKGRLTGLPRIPQPWRIKIVTGPDGSRLEAVAEHGTSEFRATYFTDFVEVDLDAGAELELRIVTTTDGERVARRLRFRTADLALRPAPSSSAPNP